jgi:hypothetical protein
MPIVFIVQEKTEHGVMKKVLESVVRPWEDPQQQSVKKKRSKPCQMRELEMQLRVNLGLA